MLRTTRKPSFQALLSPRFVRQPRRPFHSSPSTFFRPSPPTLLFGLKLPEPTNEPLAGTIAEAGASGPPWMFLLQVVVGLPAALWAYKCVMLVLFQRKIIYLPSVPPGTREESLADGERSSAVDASLSGMNWKEVEVESKALSRWLRRPVKLRGIELEWKEEEEKKAGGKKRPHVVVVYLQGNAGTPLLRAPLFRALLRPPPPSRNSESPSRSTSHLPSSYHSLPSPSPASSAPPRITLLAIAPRSYWLSTRTTPTEAGILADYRAALEHAYRTYGPEAKCVLYGHSLGGAAAVLLLEQLGRAPFPPLLPPSPTTSDSSSSSSSPSPTSPPIDALILENPLPSIPIMVRALYPQKWLPYHYLGPFAFDKWDTAGRIARLAAAIRAGHGREEEGGGRRPVRSLWVRSGRDEIVPHGEEGGVGDPVRRMYDDWVAATSSPAPTASSTPSSDDEPAARWITIPDALHDTTFVERRWREEVRGFLEEVGQAEEEKEGGE